MAEVDIATLAVRIKSEGVQETKRDLQQFTEQAGSAEARTEQLQQSTQRLITRFTALAAIGGTVALVLQASISAAAEMQSAAANLAANTGLAADEVERLTDFAQELSAATTQTAADILNAAEQVEGLVPALSGNAAAIEEVTRQAVILSEATGDKLSSSVEVLGRTLAQFGGQASDAARFTNVLVAAAQNGAAEVPDLAAALDRSGLAADRAGVTIEQAAAAVEMLANRGTSGREAIGGLKQFFDKLADSTDTRLKPSIVGLDAVLEELGERNLTAAERTKLFGEAGGRVAEQLVAGAAAYAVLTDKVTGTSAALEQAQKRMETLESAQKQLQNAGNNLAAHIGELIVPTLTTYTREAAFVVEQLGELMKAEGDASKSGDNFGGGLRALTVAFLTLTNYVGFGARTIETFARTLDDAIEGLTNPLKAFQAFSGAQDLIAKDYEDTVARIEAARERLLTPGEASILARPAEDLEEGASTKGLEAKRKATSELILNSETELQAELASVRARSFEQQIAELSEQSNELINFRFNMAEVESAFEQQVAVDKADELLRIDTEAEEERQAKLEELRRGFWESDLESVLGFYDEREAQAQKYFDEVTVPAEEQRARVLQQIHEQRERAIHQVIRRGELTNADFQKLTATQKSEFLLGVGEKLAGGLARQNKAAFQAQKVFGIASATIGMLTGAGKALEAGFPMGPINAALILAEGAARISALQSQSFESGGAAAAGGGGGASAGVATVDARVPQQEASQPQGAAQGAGGETRIFILGGGMLDERGIVDLLERVKDLVDGNDYTMFRGNSRQAADVVRSI